MLLLKNKKARLEYEISKKFQAGVVLTGAEVKSLRNKSGSLKGSHVKIIGSEAFLLNAQITPYAFADNKEYDPKKTRKLLLKKKEIHQLSEASNRKGWAVVPLAFELVGKRIKLVIGLGRGKKQYEKRAALKEKALKRDVARETKMRLR